MRSPSTAARRRWPPPRPTSTAQVKTVSTADLNDIVSAASSILTPYPTTPLKIVLSSVVADQNNNGKVAWSYANKGSRPGADSAYPVPAGLTEANSSVIVAEVTYAFTPLVDLKPFFSPGAFNMKRTFYARPRQEPDGHQDRLSMRSRAASRLGSLLR